MTRCALLRLGPAHTGVRRRILGGAVALLLAGATIAGGASRAGAGLSSDPVGCGYGSGGPYASTLCWIDMSDFSWASATSTDGQPMVVELPGGYTIDFVVRASGDRQVVPSAFPTWAGAAIGNDVYVGTPGAPALYQVTGSGSTSTIELTDLQVTDADGNPVTGWRIVGADAESTYITETITFSADTPMSTLATYTPPGSENGCQMDIQQIDADTIRCTGTEAPTTYGTALFVATEPGEFSQTMTITGGAVSVSREAVAFAIQPASIALDVVVASRVAPSDAFDVAIVSPEGAVVGSASTGAGDAASTGARIVLPREDGSGYVLRQSGAPGTNPAWYDRTWRCTRDGAAAPDLDATGVDEIVVSPAPGSLIACTVTDVAVGAPELAFTGPQDRTVALAVLGAGLVVLGLAIQRVVRKRAG